MKYAACECWLLAGNEMDPNSVDMISRTRWSPLIFLAFARGSARPLLLTIPKALDFPFLSI